ncbi:diguanylate cyclase domain-containing protein [Thiomicrospira sp. ALE5]|uniref:diguanylate cyclase domain-containing protein n=1 Tax=Thiomicrospira sp. ALE5 TaxID=748650 RepID=UPI0008E0B144|nr:diguanylate cyclase [Thiomicrospira sp. ALE5]SFR60431.1 diguanylate cyclase (GGDEF) domain-containing protein [Thiomicrospira sp. ALE5]
MYLEKKPVILIVDDEAANATLLANAFEQENLVLIAHSGTKALSIVNERDDIDIIILDIMMPDIDGFEVCKRIKNNPHRSDIPIVFVSALSETVDEEKGLNLGALDYIAKPFYLPVVRSRIKNHLALKRKNDLLAEMSQIDGLTHIANRRLFDETLAREALRLMRGNAQLSLVMLDIDSFKSYNDYYGHGLGDICLQKVASVFGSVIKRPSDLLARYGGEEFAVILPETDKLGAQVVAGKLLESVAALQIKHEHSVVAKHVTVSAGVASGSIKSYDDALPLLQRADEALYLAKKQGKNCVAAV